MTFDPSNSVIATRETRAMTAPQIVASLAKLEGWKLSGDGAAIAIEKTFAFPNFMKSMAFANAIAFIAERHQHHPELQLTYTTCTVLFRTHDVSGITHKDFACAALVDALITN
jgi:4a-hydroxytetrahydrobiopterin dehydratase